MLRAGNNGNANHGLVYANARNASSYANSNYGARLEKRISPLADILPAAFNRKTLTGGVSVETLLRGIRASATADPQRVWKAGK